MFEWFRCILSFPWVPMDEEVEEIHDLMKKDETLEKGIALLHDRIAELMETFLRSTYFSYQGNRCQQ